METSPDRLLTPNEAAEFLRVHIRTLYGLLRTGQIPEAKKLGSGPKARWRIPAEALKRFGGRG